MEQKEFIINGHVLFYMQEGQIRYYPINKISDMLLHKNITKRERDIIGDNNFKTIMVNYDKENNNIQPTKCLSFEDMQHYLRSKKYNLGTFNDEEKENYNQLLSYFDVSEKKVSIQQEYDDVFEKLCIEQCMNENENIKIKRCIQCAKEYPLNKAFFVHDSRYSDDYSLTCKYCLNNKHKSKKSINFWIKQYFVNFKNETNIDIAIHTLTKNTYLIDRLYNEWMESSITKMPNYINKKYIILYIIKELYIKQRLNKNTLGLDNIKKYFKNNDIGSVVNSEDIHLYLFGEDIYEKYWEYSCFNIKNLTINMGFKIMSKYIYYNQIKIDHDNVYKYDYKTLVHKCRISKFYQEDLLQFIYNYYNGEYISYKFNIRSEKFWTKKENRIQALKDCIEKDMKIPIEKIPLYLTKESLRKTSSTLYYILYKGNYYKNLFEWVNEVYPNRFIEADFTVNSRRMEFDSNEEMLIDEQLRDNLNNVIYNIRKDNNKNSININGMCPDWIVIGNNGCWLIEYFGLYVEHKNNKMTEDYISKTKVKLDKYKKIEESGYYKFLGLYPDDLKNDFQGLKDKINKIN